MTVSTADIPVLHSVEVVHLYLQVMLPIYQGIASSHTPLPRKRGRATLRGLYKVPLASENPLQFMGRSSTGFLADRHRSKINQGRSEEHTSELQSPCNIVCRLLLEIKKKDYYFFFY